MHKLTIDDIPNNPFQKMAAEALFNRLSHERVTLPGGLILTRSGLSYSSLKNENHQYSGTGGVSQNNAQFGFIPAFRNEKTGQVVLSKTTDGKISPIHLLEGIPNTWFSNKNSTDNTLVLVNDITSGFVRQGIFYTRKDAANAVKIFNLEDT